MPPVRSRRSTARAALALTALATLTLGAAPTTGAASSTAPVQRAAVQGPAEGEYTIRAAHSGKCLGPEDNRREWGILLVQQPCDGRPTQRVYIARMGEDQGQDYHYVFTSTGYCWGATELGFPGGWHIDQPVRTVDCGEWWQQVGLHFHAMPNGTWMITTVDSGLQQPCLHVQGGSNNDGAGLLFNGCGRPGERFELRPV
ncbi:RICIN domain-containing protein [Streptomyces sp. NPDC020965]|uniref:RICIN domain-containing protein n=1 Tax=Streptomyces sp. NPDC020965 TaxID=3365105 RepID=UPI003798B884